MFSDIIYSFDSLLPNFIKHIRVQTFIFSFYSALLFLFFCFCSFKALITIHAVVLYIELIAKWSEVLSSDNPGTFDMDIVESLHGIVSRLAMMRNSLSVMNFENFVIFKKNKLLDFLEYLHVCYKKIYDVIMFMMFHKYCMTKHRQKEREKKYAINEGKLDYYVKRIGNTMFEEAESKESNQQINQEVVNRGNLNFTKRRVQQKKTKAMRQIEGVERKKVQQRQREKRLMQEAARKRQEAQQKKKKKKKYRVKDILVMVKVEEFVKKYTVFVDNYMRKKMENKNISNNGKEEMDVDEEEDDDDAELIEQCVDEISETESDYD